MHPAGRARAAVGHAGRLNGSVRLFPDARDGGAVQRVAGAWDRP